MGISMGVMCRRLELGGQDRLLGAHDPVTVDCLCIDRLCDNLLLLQGYGGEYKKDDNFTAYEALVQEGVTFIDTAEVGHPCQYTTVVWAACSTPEQPVLSPVVNTPT